jgi:hypothetical protein
MSKAMCTRPRPDIAGSPLRQVNYSSSLAGTSRHFAASQHSGRFRTEADVGALKPSLRQAARGLFQIRLLPAEDRARQDAGQWQSGFWSLANFRVEKFAE